MNTINKEALDRHITGNYGEDQYQYNEEYEMQQEERRTYYKLDKLRFNVLYSGFYILLLMILLTINLIANYIYILRNIFSYVLGFFILVWFGIFYKNQYELIKVKEVIEGELYS